MKNLISLKAFANEIEDLPFVKKVVELDDDLLNIEVEDKDLTREEYEFEEKYYTDGFVDKMTTELNKVWHRCMGMIADFVLLDIHNVIGNIFAIGVKAK
jgi:hypothetical protein